MPRRNLAGFSSLLGRLYASLVAFIGPRESDEWEPLYANDPRFQDEDYQVVFATTRSVN